VEHSFPAADLAAPWRTRAIVAAAVAAVELVILVGIGVVLLGKVLLPHVEHAARAHALKPVAPPAHPKRVTPAGPRLARSETSVLVLNGNGRTGAAADMASRVHRFSYVISSVGNAPHASDGPTVVMYRPGFRGEGERLARDLRIKAVGPLDGMHVKDLMGAHLALIVGSD
jgi:LytR cell envelope-related transcriptional attenuator